MMHINNSIFIKEIDTLPNQITDLLNYEPYKSNTALDLISSWNHSSNEIFPFTPRLAKATAFKQSKNRAQNNYIPKFNLVNLSLVEE